MTDTLSYYVSKEQIDELCKGFLCLQVVVWVHFVWWRVIHGNT